MIDNYIDSRESYGEEYIDDAPYLGSVILDNLIFKDDEGDWTYTACNKVDRKVLEDLRIPLPGADFIIVGRGIYQADNPALAAEKYMSDMNIDD